MTVTLVVNHAYGYVMKVRVGKQEFELEDRIRIWPNALTPILVALGHEVKIQ